MTWTRTSKSSALPVALIAVLAGCPPHESAHQPPAKLETRDVATRAVRARSFQASEEAVGTVRAKVRATVEAKVSGRIQRMPVTLGQAVKAGELLATLDVREIQARLTQAQAMLEQANADLKRFSQLLGQQAVTQQEHDAAQARQRVAQASAQEARTMLSYATITAPVAGVITRKLADVGDLAAPGKPLLEIEDPRDLRLEVGVPEALIERIKQGATLPVRLAGIERELAGTVSEVAPSADPNSRTSLVKIDLPAQEQIRIGQFGRAVIPTAETTIVRVPLASLVVRGQMEIVFVVEQDKALMRLVKTGRRFADEVEIVSGLEEEEAVVIEGAERLVDGQPVRVRASAGSGEGRQQGEVGR